MLWFTVRVRATLISTHAHLITTTTLQITCGNSPRADTQTTTNPVATTNTNAGNPTVAYQCLTHYGVNGAVRGSGQ
jgi:hypothetical protein